MERIHFDNNKITVSPFLQTLFSTYLIFCFFEQYINMIVGSIGKYFIFIVIILFVISYKKIRIEWFHISMLMWLAIKIASILWVSYNQIVQQHFLSQIGMVALFISMSIVSFENRFIDIVINSLLYSSFLQGILSLFFSKPFQGVASRRVLTILGAQMDPNNQAAFLLMGVSISLYYLLNTKNRTSRFVLLIVILLVNIYAMFLTGSRGGIASLVLVFLILMLLSEKNDKLVSKQTIINCIIVLIFILVAYFLAKSYLNKDIFDRLFDFSTYEGGSNRVDIWGNAIQIFMNNPLFGGGWGSYWGYNGYYIVIHNTFLSILIDGGIIGSILFFLPVLFILISSMTQKYILPVLVLVSGLAPSFFIDAINKRFFWNAIIVSMILILSGKRLTNKIQG